MIIHLTLFQEGVHFKNRQKSCGEGKLHPKRHRLPTAHNTAGCVQKSSGMRQTASHTPENRPEKAKKSSLTCFSLENHQSDEVHPHASGARPHDVLGKSAVPSLAVACVIADLEHGRFHVVAPVQFRLRYGFLILLML